MPVLVVAVLLLSIRNGLGHNCMLLRIKEHTQKTTCVQSWVISVSCCYAFAVVFAFVVSCLPHRKQLPYRWMNGWSSHCNLRLH